jgi:hypothetical protein
MSRYTVSMRRLFPAILLFSTIAVPGAFGAAQSGSQAPSKPAVDLAALGPQIGERVPDFRLTDQTGAVRDLKSVLKRRGAMLVFFRSAEW